MQFCSGESACALYLSIYDPDNSGFQIPLGEVWKPAEALYSYYVRHD